MNKEKEEAEKESERLKQEAKESDELLKIYTEQEKSREKIKTLEKYKEDHKPVKKQNKFFSKLGKVLSGSGKVIRKLQEEAGKLEIAQPSKLDMFGNLKSKKKKKRGSIFITLILVLIIAVVFLSGCDKDYTDEIKRIDSNMTTNKIYCIEKEFGGLIECDKSCPNNRYWWADCYYDFFGNYKCKC